VPIPPPFRCETDDGRVRPIGELDIATVPEVDRHLRELVDGGGDRVVLDLRDVTFMDSSGLRLILRWQEAAKEDGHTFGLIAGPPAVERVFHITRMRSLLTFVDPPDAA
jgi:anti-sigma B factor antagonist